MPIATIKGRKLKVDKARPKGESPNKSGQPFKNPRFNPQQKSPNF